MQMGLIARRDLEDGGFDLDEALLGEKAPYCSGNGAPCLEEGPSVEVPLGRPKRRDRLVPSHQPATLAASKRLASNGKISMLRPETGAEVRFEAPSPPSI